MATPQSTQRQISLRFMGLSDLSFIRLRQDVMYLSRTLDLLLLWLMSPLLPDMPLLLLPIWYRHQKFKTTACTSLLMFLNTVAAALLLLQRGCCNAAATRLLQRCCCCFFGGCYGLINKLAALVAVDNTSAVEVEYRLPSSSLLVA